MLLLLDCLREECSLAMLATLEVGIKVRYNSGNATRLSSSFVQPDSISMHTHIFILIQYIRRNFVASVNV